MVFASLVKGPALIIDDALNPESPDRDDPIYQIEAQFRSKSIPIIERYDIPEIDEMAHFSSASFVVIDWELLSIPKIEPDGDNTIEGIDIIGIPPNLRQEKFKEIADFILNLQHHFFGPVFIFSNDDETFITEKLRECWKELGDEKIECLLKYIFIKQKANLIENQLFQVIDEWLEKTPSVYTILFWNMILKQSVNELSWHLFSLNPSWPVIFYNTYQLDSSDPGIELGNLLSRNLFSRMGEKFAFNPEYFKDEGPKQSPDHVNKVICGERYIPNKDLSKNFVAAGDLFIRDDDSKKFYLNLRPNCDCILRKENEKENETVDNVSLYLIHGNTISNREFKKSFVKKYHNFKEQHNYAIVPFIQNRNGKVVVVKFNFEDLKIIKFADLKEQRIGRILPPHITHVRQKYASYIQREGLMPIPFFP